MPSRQDIDAILRTWSYQPGEVVARVVKAADGREVVQMRVEMGVLQMEVSGRPDGIRPHNSDSYFAYLKRRQIEKPDESALSEDDCAEADREFVQFYHRRMCWLALRQFDKAVRDADHTLAFMDFVRDYSPAEEWTLSHEQYRPFVLFHRAQAGALSKLEHTGPESAILEINQSLVRFRDFFEQFEAEEHYDDNELVTRLEELKESIRQHYHLGRTLPEQLSDAVAAEDYELAARLRDQLAERESSES
ncbi:MAG: UvrB/UvrC motif-containing protein [Planctomycetia bacterium]|nr:UvrB/UvrC motif-containing protein [Planctomycetia bacterium]